LLGAARHNREKGHIMDRRKFLKTAAGAAVLTGGLAAPAVSQRAAARTLRFVPQADLANFDPIWSTTNCGAQRLGAGLGHALRRG
jgi:hypothetical protein